MRGDPCIDCNRIAAGIAKRVGELLPAEPAPVLPDILEPWPDNDVESDGAPETTPPPPTAPAPLPEAPASVNVRVQVAGREVQWTLRDHDEARLARRLEELLQRYPLPQASTQPQAQLSPQQHNAAAMHQRVTDFCPIHNVAMKWHENAKGVWFSHFVDGHHCKGR